MVQSFICKFKKTLASKVYYKSRECCMYYISAILSEPYLTSRQGVFIKKKFDTPFSYRDIKAKTHFKKEFKFNYRIYVREGLK